MSFATLLSNEQLINLTVETAHRVSCLSESNDLAELREELLSRLTKRAVDVANACHCGDDLFAVNPDGNCAWCKSPRN